MGVCLSAIWLSEGRLQARSEVCAAAVSAAVLSSAASVFANVPTAAAWVLAMRRGSPGQSECG